MSISDYSTRAEAQIRQYEAQPEIHDLPAIFHLWSNSFLCRRRAAERIKSVAAKISGVTPEIRATEKYREPINGD